MVSLYITSLEAAAGRSTICAGIGRWLSGEGKKVGFLKPLVITEAQRPEVCDDDAQFMKQALNLAEPLESLNPFTLTLDALREFLTVEKDGLVEKVADAYGKVSREKDVVIIEGLSGFGVDEDMTRASYQVVEALEAKVIVLVRYVDALPLARIVAASERLGDSLLGLVVNCAPADRLEEIYRRMTTLFQGKGLRLLAVLPEERTLFAISVGELARQLGGEVMASPEGSDKLVENIMVGALCVDPGVEYFRRKANKAVVTRSERPDIQLAAMETSTRCLVLSGNTPPNPKVLYQAEDKGVPIILVEQDTPAALASIEDALSRARLCDERKLSRLEQMMARHFDFPALYQGLGLIA
ncbi:DRTGG domain-containing protein [Chloroflexota bacterium]